MVKSLDEIDYYIKNAEENLESSIALYEIKKYRNSLSLSYYSMFMVAKGLLMLKGYTTKSHDGVKKGFSQEYVNKGIFDRKYYQELSKSETLRIKADYDVTITFDEKTAKERIDVALDFLDKAKIFLENNL